jgi:Tfp pilus assembly protein PilN
MIRINLLGGTPRARRGGGGGKSRPAPEMMGGGGEGPSTVVFILLGAVLAVAGVMLYNMKIAAEKKSLDNELAAAMRENQRLADVKAQYERTKREADAFQRRVSVINDLKTKQTGPHDLLELVATTVSASDAVWLESMTDDGKALTFDGMALSPNAVADLMANLQKTGKFKSVEIKEASQDTNVKELQAFKFELICERLPDTPAAKPDAPKAPAASKS